MGLVLRSIQKICALMIFWMIFTSRRKLPETPGMKLNIDVGDYVYGGETIVATY